MLGAEMSSAGPERGPLWVYGCNDHLVNEVVLPEKFDRSGLLKKDFEQACSLVGAVPHPAFKYRPSVQPKSRRPSAVAMHRRPSAQPGDTEDPDIEAAKEAALSQPLLAVRSVLLDRPSMQILSKLLPTSQHLRQICFSDCRLDVEMVGLLRRGLADNCSIEALQIEWNPFELSLPTSEEMEAAIAEIGAEFPKDETDGWSLESRERYRYRLQSRRHLRAFRDWLAGTRGGSLAAVWEDLQETPEDRQLSVDAFHALFDKFGIGGPQITEIFEVLDGPDFATGMGRTTLSRLRAALDTLPEQQDSAEEEPRDPIGEAFAPFFDGECVVESISLRACSVGWYEIQLVAEALKASPWQLRGLNLWDNRLCDRSARLLADALNEYRGLEFLGLGRNRITDAGLVALCQVFQATNLDETTAKQAIKDQEVVIAAKAKAAAKAKGKAAPKAAAAGVRVRREKKDFTEVYEELPPVVEGGEPTYRSRIPAELKLLCLSENPIKNVKTIETLQPLGPKGSELLLKLTAAAQALLAKKPELASKDKKPYCPGGEGWVVRAA